MEIIVHAPHIGNVTYVGVGREWSLFSKKHLHLLCSQLQTVSSAGPGLMECLPLLDRSIQIKHEELEGDLKMYQHENDYCHYYYICSLSPGYSTE